MKKTLNRSADLVPEMLDSLLKANPSQLTCMEEAHAIVRADAPVQGKVGLSTGGGSRHLPVFLGYVGKRMLNDRAVGDVFASPSTDTMLTETRRVNGGKRVVYIHGDNSGDVMNLDMASEMADLEGVPVRTGLVRDGVASAPPAEAQWRRGVTGMVFAFKIARAKAELGGSPDADAGMAANKADPSTMGTLLATGLISAGKEVLGKAELSPANLVRMLQAAERGMQRRGKAILGDKTILDALHPACAAFDVAIEPGPPLRDAGLRAVAAAEDGRDRVARLRRGGRADSGSARRARSTSVAQRW